jgi:hypothetical protein
MAVMGVPLLMPCSMNRLVKSSRWRNVPLLTSSSVPASRGSSGGEADPESFGFAGPAFAFGFGDAGVEVVADLLQAVPLGGVDSQEWASDARLTEMILSWDWSLPLRLTSLTVIRDLYGTWQPGVSPHGSGWPGRGDE